MFHIHRWDHTLCHNPKVPLHTQANHTFGGDDAAAEVDGEASTLELVTKFKRTLPSQQSPLFKAFLQQICDFRRDHEGKGIWKLKSEFR